MNSDSIQSEYFGSLLLWKNIKIVLLGIDQGFALGL